MPLEFVIPDEWADGALYERFGAVIKEVATGKIVGFVQEVNGGLLDALPAVDPVSIGIKVIKFAVEHAQKQKQLELLQSIQLTSTVGAVASVATLGVSVAGFALVLRKLDRMEEKLDQLLVSNEKIRGLVEKMSLKVDMLSRAKLHAALDEIALMAHATDQERRRAALARAVESVAQMKHYYLALLASPGFYEVRTADVPALLEAHERLFAACYGELVGEYLLGDDVALLDERLRRMQTSFATIDAHDERLLFRRLTDGDRSAGVELITPREERIEAAKALVSIWKESEARLASVPQVARLVRAAGLSPERFQELAEQQGQRTGLPLVGVRIHVG